MVPNFSILGRLPMPLPTGFCALTGSNQVIDFLVLFVRGSSPILFLGYDKVIEDRRYDVDAIMDFHILRWISD